MLISVIEKRRGCFQVCLVITMVLFIFRFIWMIAETKETIDAKSDPHSETYKDMTFQLALKWIFLRKIHLNLLLIVKSVKFCLIFSYPSLFLVLYSIILSSNCARRRVPANLITTIE